MNVSQLIKQLKELPPETPVYIHISEAVTVVADDDLPGSYNIRGVSRGSGPSGYGATLDVEWRDR